MSALQDPSAHVALIQQQEGCELERARFIAWQEGPRGYKRRRRADRLSAPFDEPLGAYVVVAEFHNQGPIVMEAEGIGTSYDAAGEHAERLRSSGRVLRTCIASLTYEAGNELLIKDLERMQK